MKITKFQYIWSYSLSGDKGATFYKPIGIPDGYFPLGHHSQANGQSLHGFVIVAKESDALEADRQVDMPALKQPFDYKLVWTSNDFSGDDSEGCGYFWYPCPPDGYRSMGYLVTANCEKPSLEEVRCVRCDLTDTCETDTLVAEIDSTSAKYDALSVWSTRPRYRGMWEKGLSVGTFFCSSCGDCEEDLDISCLKNLNSSLDAMPTLEQVHALIKEYGPTVFFHPNEIYLPSSVSWFFESGSLLYKSGESDGEAIDLKGSNLPRGGQNDGEYWLDLPYDDTRDTVKKGDLESAELYAHIKPALGGTFTDIAMWVFCPFNGPATVKFGILDIPLSRVGQHVADWEHFTLRVSNFTGELWKIYYSQHSGGEWVDASNLEYIQGNRAIVYSSRNGHASFPHPGNYLQGSSKLGIGIRNDAARSNLFVDSSVKYRIFAAEYLKGSVCEPYWLQYMREWGPTIVYNSKTELDKLIGLLPSNIRLTVESLFEKLPVELYGEEGPTGPKEKNMWFGDERC